jgi:hypothetical protein
LLNLVGSFELGYLNAQELGKTIKLVECRVECRM